MHCRGCLDIKQTNVGGGCLFAYSCLSNKTSPQGSTQNTSELFFYVLWYLLLQLGMLFKNHLICHTSAVCWCKMLVRVTQCSNECLALKKHSAHTGIFSFSLCLFLFLTPSRLTANVTSLYLLLILLSDWPTNLAICIPSCLQVDSSAHEQHMDSIK